MDFTEEQKDFAITMPENVSEKKFDQAVLLLTFNSK
jgi:hypothetical protein